MFDAKRLVSNVPFIRRMNIVKTKNFVVAVAVRLYKVVAGKMGVCNGADKQVPARFLRGRGGRRVWESQTGGPSPPRCRLRVGEMDYAHSPSEFSRFPLFLAGLQQIALFFRPVAYRVFPVV